jgi:Ca2+-binding RTX toxin-like protein
VAQIKVDSVAGLTTALKAAQSGDTILLASGTYSGASLSGFKFPGGVTITSADPTHLAVVTNFNVVGSEGLTFSNLEMVARSPANFAFIVNGSSNINFDHVSLHGSLDGNAGNDVSGLQVLNSTNVSLTNSELQQLARGMAVGTSSNITVANNYVHDMRTDGFDFAGVSYVKVVDNVLKNFTPAVGDHPDAIQFWTQGTTTASHDILISGNLILRSDTGGAQGIFMGDEVGTLHFERVTVSNNLLVGTGINALRINGAKDLTLTNNELVTFSGYDKTYILIQNADGVTATSNKSILYGWDKVTGLVTSGNVTTTAVTDSGAAALKGWFTLHPEDLAVVNGSWTSTTSAPAPEPAPAPAPEPTPAPEPVTVKMQTSTATPDLVGTDVNNAIYGDYRVNKLFGMGGNDTLDGGGGGDTLVGGTGNDLYFVPNSLAVVIENAGEGTDTVIAKGDYTLGANVENLQISTSANNSWMGKGNTLNNVITGNGGNNYLDGLAGNDTINGAVGNDIVIGGAGNDRLTGGEGADVFRFSLGGGKDVITDMGYGDARDTIDASAYFRAGFKAVLQDVGSDVVINFSNGDSITLLGTHASDLTSISGGGWVF